MTPAQSRSTWPQQVPQPKPRLRLKPKALPTGYVDGAWWPHSTNLVAELPDLLAVLSVRLGPISHVAYHPGEWSKPPAVLVTGGHSVRLGGYRRQHRSTLEIVGVGGTSAVLLVVPPDADADQAHESMLAAARPENASTTAGLLVARKR